MHPFIWAALGAVLATPVVVVATLFVALLRQAMNTTQVRSLARQKRLGPRKGVTSGDPAAAEGASCTSEPLKPLPAIFQHNLCSLARPQLDSLQARFFPDLLEHASQNIIEC